MFKKWRRNITPRLRYAAKSAPKNFRRCSNGMKTDHKCGKYLSHHDPQLRGNQGSRATEIHFRLFELYCAKAVLKQMATHIAVKFGSPQENPDTELCDFVHNFTSYQTPTPCILIFLIMTTRMLRAHARSIVGPECSFLVILLGPTDAPHPRPPPSCALLINPV